MAMDLDLHAARGTLEDLVGYLESYDVTVPGLEAWNDLRIETLKRPQPPMPDNLLERTADELDAWARDVAAYRVATRKPNDYGHALGGIRPALDEALKSKIKENSESILSQLRPDFDQAAAGLKAAVAQGVQPADTIESLFRASIEVRDAWLSTHAHAASLDEIFGIRQLLSAVANVEPVIYPGKFGRSERSNWEGGHISSGVDWNVTILDPAGGLNLEPYNREAPWQRWIRVAPHLRLA